MKAQHLAIFLLNFTKKERQVIQDKVTPKTFAEMFIIWSISDRKSKMMKAFRDIINQLHD